MEKERFQKFCGAFINFQKFMKSESFEFNVADVILVNVYTYITFHP